MTNKEFFQILKTDPIMQFYSRATIQAIVSQVELAIDQAIDSICVLEKNNRYKSLIISAVKEWERIKKTFDFDFPPLFITSAIRAYSGEKSEYYLDSIGLEWDNELASLLATWLPENYRRGCPITDPRITKRKPKKG